MKRVFILLVLLVLVVSISSGKDKPADFKLKTLGGKYLKLKNFIGEKVILVNFWATWCKPCMRELPEFNRIYLKYKDKGFILLSINTDPSANLSQVKTLVKRFRLKCPVLLDKDNQILQKYNPTRALPYSVLINKEGYIEERFIGYKSGDEKKLETLIKKLIKGTKKEEEGKSDE